MSPAPGLPIDTMETFTQTPQWRPKVVARFEPRLIYVGADGRQVSLRLSEADLWALGQEVAQALLTVRSRPLP